MEHCKTGRGQSIREIEKNPEQICYKQENGGQVSIINIFFLENGNKFLTLKGAELWEIIKNLYDSWDGAGSFWNYLYSTATYISKGLDKRLLDENTKIRKDENMFFISVKAARSIRTIMNTINSWFFFPLSLRHLWRLCQQLWLI